MTNEMPTIEEEFVKNSEDEGKLADERGQYQQEVARRRAAQEGAQEGEETIPLDGLDTPEDSQ